MTGTWRRGCNASGLAAQGGAAKGRAQQLVGWHSASCLGPCAAIMPAVGCSAWAGCSLARRCCPASCPPVGHGLVRSGGVPQPLLQQPLGTLSRGFLVWAMCLVSRVRSSLSATSTAGTRSAQPHALGYVFQVLCCLQLRAPSPVSSLFFGLGPWQGPSGPCLGQGGGCCGWHGSGGIRSNAAGVCVSCHAAPVGKEPHTSLLWLLLWR
jgi:hypothetical protein